jgi:hypothetical protein
MVAVLGPFEALPYYIHTYTIYISVQFKAYFLLLYFNFLFLNYMHYVGARRLEYDSQSSTDANVFPLLSREKCPPMKHALPENFNSIPPRGGPNAFHVDSQV